MSKFKVGDKVRVKVFDKRPVTWNSYGKMDKWMGKVVTILECFNEKSYRIKEDPQWAFNESHLDAEPRREFIVIRRSGAETIAELRHDREVIKSAKATCAPSDTFDFVNEGAPRAFDRLMGREEPKPAPKKFFSVGDRVVTLMGSGMIDTVDKNSDLMPYLILYDTGERHWIKSNTAKLEPQPAPQPAHRFKVGERVLHEEYGIGTIIGYVNHVAGVPYEVRPDNVFCSIYCWAESRVSPAPAPEPPKFYTGKVVCIKDWRQPSRVGMVFEFVDGQLQGDNKRMSNVTVPKYESFEQFKNARNAVEWIEVKD